MSVRKLAITFVTFACAVSLAVVFAFHASTSEEGPWLYQIGLVTGGKYPGLDFFSPYPYGFFLPYAAIIRWLAVSFEAGRLVSYAMTLGGAALVWLALRRLCGPGWAWIAVGTLLVNSIWLVSNVLISTPTVSNFGLIVGFFALAYPSRPHWGWFLLAGFGLGLSVSARLITVPVLLIVPLAAILLSNGMWKKRTGFLAAMGRCTAAAIGTLVMSVPDLILFLQGPSDFIYLRGGAFFEAFNAVTPPAPPGLLHTVLAKLSLFGGFFLIKAQNSIPQNALFLVALAGLIAAALRQSGHHGMRLAPSAWLAPAFLFLLCLAYGLSHHSQPEHLQQAVVFVITSLVIAAHAALGPLESGWSTMSQWRRWGLVALLVAYALPGLAYMSWQVVFRHHPGIGQVLTTARLACWIESSTEPDETIVDYFVNPTVAAGRRLPVGMETGTNWLFWAHIAPDKRARLGIKSPESLGAELVAAHPAIVLDEPLVQKMLDEMVPAYRAALADGYQSLGTAGGTWQPFQILAAKDWLAGRDVPPLPSETPLTTLGTLRQQGAAAFLLGLGRDTAVSLAALSADLARSWAWATGASHDRRCAGLL